MKRAAWLLALALSCASDKGAQAGGKEQQAPAEGGDLVDTPETQQQRDAAVAVVLQCSRLTFSSTERPVEAVLHFDREARPVGLRLQGPDDAVKELMCPADVTARQDVLGDQPGRPWGKETRVGWRAVVWCAPALDGNGGTCSSSSEELRPAAPASSSVAQGGSVQPSAGGTVLGRASDPRIYKLRRLRVDFPGDEPPGLATHLAKLDRALTLCLHVQQPDLNTARSTDFHVVIRVDTRQQAIAAPLMPVGGQPAELTDGLLGCVARVVLSEEAPGVDVKVAYSVVSSVSTEPPGTNVQRVEVALVQERVEYSLAPEVRSAATKALLETVRSCASSYPVEVLSASERWAAPPPIRLVGTADSTRRDGLHFRTLSAEAPAVLKTQADCVVQRVPAQEKGTAANVEWLIQVRVSSLGEP
ncbi:MAG: hypothetical protein AB2A00_32245 [Myxococcota bacterium]